MAIGLVIAGAAPILSRGIIPPAGSLVLTGFVNGLSVPYGTLAFQGFAPSVSSSGSSVGNTTFTPNQGTLVLGTIVSNSFSVSVPVGAFAFSSFAPGIINPAALVPPAGTLTLTPFAPYTSQIRTPGAATLTLTPTASVMNLTISPAQAILRCTNSVRIKWAANTEPDLAGYKVYHGIVPSTYTESVDVGNVLFYVWANLPFGNNYFSVTAYDTSANESAFSTEVSSVMSGMGWAPSVTVQTGGAGSILIAGNVGAANFGTYAVSVLQNNPLIPPSATLSLTGHQPAWIPDAGQVQLTGQVPAVTQSGTVDFNRTPLTGALTLTGYTKLEWQTPAFGVVTFQGMAPTATIQFFSPTITPSAGALVFFSPVPFNPEFARHANAVIDAGGSPVDA